VPSSDHPEALRLGSSDITELSEDQLVEAIQRSEQLRKEGRARSGRLLAELHRRGHLSWPAIARLTGIRQTTAYELAQPYLAPDTGDESGTARA
jgi:hypothetical protein